MSARPAALFARARLQLPTQQQWERSEKQAVTDKYNSRGYRHYAD